MKPPRDWLNLVSVFSFTIIATRFKINFFIKDCVLINLVRKVNMLLIYPIFDNFGLVCRAELCFIMSRLAWLKFKSSTRDLHEQKKSCFS